MARVLHSTTSKMPSTDATPSLPSSPPSDVTSLAASVVTESFGVFGSSSATAPSSPSHSSSPVPMEPTSEGPIFFPSSAPAFSEEKHALLQPAPPASRPTPSLSSLLSYVASLAAVPSVLAGPPSVADLIVSVRRPRVALDEWSALLTGIPDEEEPEPQQPMSFFDDPFAADTGLLLLSADRDPKRRRVAVAVKRTPALLLDEREVFVKLGSLPPHVDIMEFVGQRTHSRSFSPLLGKGFSHALAHLAFFRDSLKLRNELQFDQTETRHNMVAYLDRKYRSPHHLLVQLIKYVFREVPFGICILPQYTSPLNSTMWMNKAALDMLGYSRRDFLDHELLGSARFLTDETQRVGDATRQEALQSRKNSCVIRGRLIHKSGSLVDAEITMHFIYDANQSCAFTLGHVRKL